MNKNSSRLNSSVGFLQCSPVFISAVRNPRAPALGQHKAGQGYRGDEMGPTHQEHPTGRAVNSGPSTRKPEDGLGGGGQGITGSRKPSPKASRSSWTKWTLRSSSLASAYTAGPNRNATSDFLRTHWWALIQQMLIEDRRVNQRVQSQLEEFKVAPF